MCADGQSEFRQNRASYRAAWYGSALLGYSARRRNDEKTAGAHYLTSLKNCAGCSRIRVSHQGLPLIRRTGSAEYTDRQNTGS